MRHILWLGLLLPSLCQAQTNTTWKVSLYVSINEPDLKDEVMSFLMRELRTLGDINIVAEDSSPEYSLRVTGFKTTNQGGKTTGYVFSVLFLQPISRGLVDLILKDKLSSVDLKSAQASFANATFIKDSQLYTGPTDNVRKQCEDITVSFDRTVMQPARDGWELFFKNQKKP
jgi:hypothetical protein